MIDSSAITHFSFYWILFALLLFPMLLFVKQPYGRHIRKGWRHSMPNNIAWIVMEFPALTVFAAIFIYYRNFNPTVIFLVLLWLVHYIHRTLIFPFKIKTKGKRMPILIVVFGFIFNMVNASINGFSINLFEIIGKFSQYEYFRVGIGILLFGVGMFINIYSDYQLIHLRKSATNGYLIPQKFLFRFVSCPNYFGEIMEWTGFAIIAYNPAALSFAVWTIVNLLPRAIDHHKWYKKNFSGYPVNRKAIIPYIL
jgi:steroid 5-alpha reductase family enzyme